LKDSKSVECNGTTQIGLHSVQNMLGNETQITLFNSCLLEKLPNGENLSDKISRFGIELTDLQSKIMEGILRGFTETNYKGNIEPKDPSQIAKEKYAKGDLPPTYKYVKKIPRLQVTQSQLLDWAGINRNSIAEIQRALEALSHLGMTQYCFYYDRLAYDRNGVPERKKNGDWKKEEVMAVDTLFTIKYVRDKESKILKHYEIEPSPIFLDQRDSYFMLIPYNWREEVCTIVGNKKASSYTFRFLLFLRYQYEIQRRTGKKKPPLSLKRSWEEIAVAIKMPESFYKRQKARAMKIVEDAYSVAKSLGYLIDYKKGEKDLLIFNEEKYYPHPKQRKTLTVDSISPEANQLFTLFHTQKKKSDKGHKEPTGEIQKEQLAIFDELLASRSKDEIAKVIEWGLSKKYWCTQMGTPKKLTEVFSDAVSEMNNSGKKSESEKEEENKKFCEEILLKIKDKNVKIEMFSTSVEIGDGAYPTCILYKDHGFKEQFLNELRKYEIYL